MRQIPVSQINRAFENALRKHEGDPDVTKVLTDLRTEVLRGKPIPYLYHVTDEEHARRILSEGTIRVHAGANSRMAGDGKKAAYLCGWRDIPYWRQLLDKHVVLRVPGRDVDQSEECFHRRKYSGYMEYVSDKDVVSKDIALSTSPAPSAETNAHLCENYIYDVNRMCLDFLHHYEGTVFDRCSIREIAKDAENTLRILRRLRYGDVTKACWKRIEEELVDSCCYAFCDVYDNTDRRVWEQLALYPEDESYETRKDVQDFIKENLAPILYAHTGGIILADFKDRT